MGLKEALEGGNLTEAQIFEGNVITILGLIFTLCIVEGLTVAASVCISWWPKSAAFMHFQTSLYRYSVHNFRFVHVLHCCFESRLGV